MPRLYHQLVEQLQGQVVLPGWLVWVKEVDNQGEEDLTLGDQEAVILLISTSTLTNDKRLL